MRISTRALRISGENGGSQDLGRKRGLPGSGRRKSPPQHLVTKVGPVPISCSENTPYDTKHVGSQHLLLKQDITQISVCKNGLLSLAHARARSFTQKKSSYHNPHHQLIANLALRRAARALRVHTTATLLSLAHAP